MEKENYQSLNNFWELLDAQLVQMTGLIRGKLESVARKNLISIITTDVHNRAIVEQLIKTR